MVKKDLKTLLAEGEITQEQYEFLVNGKTSSIGKTVGSILLTIWAVVGILFGTCVIIVMS